MQSWLQQITHLGHLHGCRHVIFLQGQESWAWTWIGNHLELDQHSLIVGESPQDQNLNNLNPNKPNNLLGYESKQVIFNAHSGLYPDALTAVSGTLKPGGLLFILCPDVDSWPTLEDSFALNRHPHGMKAPANNQRMVQRLIESVSNHGFYTIKPNQAPPKVLAMPLPSWEPLAKDALTLDQAAFLMAHSPHTTDPNRIDVITADRGRGKSYLLGLYANLILEKLIDNGIKSSLNPTIYLTAPNKRAVSSVLKACPQGIHFLAPEDVLTQVKKEDTLLIDEAASLPIPTLIKWSTQLGHMVFATTTHGYEGTGKGFQIRFLQHLNRLKNKHWHHHELHHPVRFCPNDPLENWLFKSFCLNGTVNTSNHQGHELSQVSIQKFTQKQLAQSPQLLTNIFALLVQAHYQTRPSDLRDLLDAPGMHIFAMTARTPSQSEPIVICACLATDEGPIEEALHLPIQQGYRRPKGHLIPQSLAYYMGINAGLPLKGARIIRIATNPHLQRKAYASEVLSFCRSWFKGQSYDYVGSSFSATQDVIEFWQKNKFSLVRMGSKKDKASGTVSALVLKGISEQGKELQKASQHEFNHLNTNCISLNDLSTPSLQVLKTFTAKKGSFDSSQAILKKLPIQLQPIKSWPQKANQQIRETIGNWLFKNDLK